MTQKRTRGRPRRASENVAHGPGQQRVTSFFQTGAPASPTPPPKPTESLKSSESEGDAWREAHLDRTPDASEGDDYSLHTAHTRMDEDDGSGASSEDGGRGGMALLSVWVHSQCRRR